MPQAEIDPLPGGKDFEKRHHIVEVVERLPNPHQYDIGNPSAQILLGGIDFIKHLGGGQIAHPARQRGSAEPA